MFGGSWGSTLSLIYAIKNPSRVISLTLRGIFLCRKFELLWFYQYGASEIFPDEFEEYISVIPKEERNDLISSFYKYLTSSDANLRSKASAAWTKWELSTSHLINKKFDLIISTGVIHHLENPLSALKYFEDNLKEDGVIILMVYGKFQRYGLNQIKKVFNEINLNQDKDSIISSKKIINNLHPKHPANIFNISKDINYDSGIIDLLLHKQEKFYSIEELLNELKESNLILKNVYEEGLKHLTKFFTFNQNIINKIINEKLQQSLGKTIQVNSYHNNILKSESLGENLQKFAITDFDNTIEGIMHKNKPIMGVMWHPERAPNKESKLILKTVFCDKDFWK